MDVDLARYIEFWERKLNFSILKRVKIWFCIFFFIFEYFIFFLKMKNHNHTVMHTRITPDTRPSLRFYTHYSVHFCYYLHHYTFFNFFKICKNPTTLIFSPLFRTHTPSTPLSSSNFPCWYSHSLTHTLHIRSLRKISPTSPLSKPAK